RIGETLNREALETDLQAIMGVGYFADVQVKAEKFLNGVKLIFTVIENPLFKEVRITGLTKVKPEELKTMFTQKSGEVFNTVTFKNDLEKITKHYREQKGLFLEPKLKGGLTADGVINLEVIELKVGKIKIVGLEKTKEYVVRRELTIKEGEVFDTNLVKEDIYRIGRLRLFDSIDPKMEAGATPNTIDLVIELKEAATGSFQIGASYSETTNQMGGLLVFSEDNLMGLGQSISLDTNISEDGNNVSFNFIDPWLDNKGTSFQLSVWNSDSEITSTMNSWGFKPDAKDVNGALLLPGEHYDLDLNRTGMLLSFGRRFWTDTTAKLKFNFEKNTIQKVYRDGDSNEDNNYIKDVSEAKHSTDFWDNSIGVELVKNKLQNDGRSFVKGGYQLKGSYSIAGPYLGGEYDYQSALLEGKWFRSLTPNLVLGTRLQGNFIHGDYPDYDRLYMGGMFKLRGYEDRRFDNSYTEDLIGSGYVLSNTELRYRLPANKSLEFVVFGDVGQITDSDSKGLKYDYGVGIRYD
ncbi:MAG TPA: BamA/TamA family outer membrane protein, partial [Bacillota bacterium]|nr:BamA/TamA family outer membrane protein [Bacillota bacterium]